ncbi:NAD-dependent deacylase [Flavobacterium sp. MAH-1]|uniref:NAD-dependent protein deacylase n=1 Tax=Flavobacterium agri TaxID=2743471 RepID=A0A7Y8XYJ0_9FLAO|nr:NAD-dependent deacylase [Flavobacterium agri]NUY79285.1 NAD-dependent deacylase [Flavobacterium agri]NYA69309.1 NAD-dependent deacylase [Flavobacterium agri]
MKKKLVVLTGAGISAESGIKTFRDADGLWEGHDVMEVASPEGWRKNPELVLDFYNQRRRQLKEVRPNAAHTGLAELEKDFEVHIITQNVDNLHERGGSTSVLHLHGELLKVRSIGNPNHILDWEDDLYSTHTDPDGFQLRPHIVWFGEEVPALEEAVHLTDQADIFAVIGTSLQVYPAAGLVSYTRPDVPVFYIDPKPAGISGIGHRLEVISTSATEGITILKERLAKEA